MEKYDPQKIEQKWQERWEKEPELWQAQEKSDRPKFYCLDMFPYPSGDGLHVGHVENYTATDIYSRYQRMNGKNVLHPIGWDAFGLPAENFAIKTGVHPDQKTHENIKNFTRQIKRLGMSYDWTREIDTSSPEYYKWTQWFFLLLFKNGLAYKKKAKVNWCESCQTVLANEQVVNGECERCTGKVIQKDLEQWFFKITDFVEDLIKDLDKVDWPESTKLVQKNWIGKSEGAEFEMEIKNSGSKIKVFTTRLDTVFGMTYVVIAPENPIIEDLKDKIENYSEVKEYIRKSKEKTDLERTELQKEKTGVELKGIKAANPFTEEEIPVFVADYVLSGYGTGAVMAVPAHDERDWEFAKKYNLPIGAVIAEYVEFWDEKTQREGMRLGSRMTRRTFGAKKENSKLDDNLINAHKAQAEEQVQKGAITQDGWVFNSGVYSGFRSEYVRSEMMKWLEEEGIGKKKINYKLRDWLVSRQRYWGAPIPIIYCPNCGMVPVPEKDLPVELPTDVDFKPTGESPLVNSKTFHDVKCPVCGEKSRRESDTLDTFVCSSWYYFRYADPKNEKEFASKKELEKWMPVDFYMGGKEHTVLHLLYARFFTKVLKKYGYINFDEPFTKLRHQGIILAEDNSKMSKSKGNVVNPDDIVKEYGADALRLYEMFMGPIEDMKSWNTNSIVGPQRFLEKVHMIYMLFSNVYEGGKSDSKNGDADIRRIINKKIKKVTDDIENLKFNTAISALMIALSDQLSVSTSSTFSAKVDREFKEKFLILLAPFAPHISEELWEKLGHKKSIFFESWPKYDEKLIQEEEIEMVIQVNGKLRDRIKISAEISEDDAKKLATESERIKQFIDTKEIKKIIFVKGKLINIVI
jgi:leucyl-tRNA synthetase